MTRRFRLRWVAPVLTAIALLAGCSTASKAPAPAAPPATPAPATSTPATSAPANPVVTKEITVRVAHTGNQGSAFDINGAHFKQVVEERSGGKIHVQVYCCSQLAKQAEMLQQLQLGTLEMAISASEMASTVPEFNVFELPYLFKDRSDIQSKVEGAFGQQLYKYMDAKGLVGLAIWENGFRVITNNRGPIRKPEDLKGLKIRVPPTADRIKMFQLFGAQPGPLDFNELFSALQTGVFDAQENPMQQITSSKLYEVQKYLSVSNHVYTPATVVASKVWWDKLEPAAQQILRQAAIEEGRAARDLGAKMDKDGLDLVKSKGVQVNDDVDIAAFQKLGQPMYDDFAKKYGQAFMDLALGKTK